MLKIDGVTMPEPKGITFSKEKIWSKNTGRTTDATMVGDIIAIKTKMQISFGCLSGTQVTQLDEALSKSFVSVYFKDPRQNAYVEQPFYSGTPSYPVYSYVDGLPEYVGTAVDLVEQ